MTDGTHSQHVSSASPTEAPIIETLQVGALQANCYLIICPQTRHAAILDPGDEAPRILDRVRALDVNVVAVMHTHGHFDHICATAQVLAGLPARVPLGAHPADAYLYTGPVAREMTAAAASFGYVVPDDHAQPDRALEDGAEVSVGGLGLSVLHTPGHTPGGISLLCAPWCVFTGDTLFRRGVGRTDLAGGDEDALYASIETRLYPLDSALTVYPGHGLTTTIGEERRLNPFVRG